MTCVGRAPATLDEWLSLIDTCATAAGGSDWVSDAMVGLAVVLMAALLLTTLFGLLRMIR